MKPALSGQRRQNFLPPPVTAHLVRWLGRASGCGLLLAAAATMVGLFTGSGAVVIDLVGRGLGAASAIALLAPALLGLELARFGRVDGWRTRLALFAVASGALSGALAGQGMGGLLGDGVLDLGAIPFATLGAGADTVVAALACAGFGSLALFRAMRLAVPRLDGLARTAVMRPFLNNDRPRALTWPHSLLGGEDEKRNVSTWESPLPRGERVRARGRGRSELIKPGSTGTHHRTRREPVLPFPVDAPSETRGDDPPGELPLIDLEVGLDLESRAIARRFAPPSSNRKTWTPIGGLPEPRLKREPPTPPLETVRDGRIAMSPRHGDAARAQWARMIEDAFAGLGLPGAVRGITPGPTVTLFEFKPGRMVPRARMVGLSGTLSRTLGTPPIRITAQPGRGALDLEVPNIQRETVLLSEMLDSASFRASNAQLPVVIGKAIGGEPIVADLARMPHLLIAGATGSGKSMGLHAIVLSLLHRQTPATCRLLLIDAKAMEFSAYAGSPHLLAPVVTERGKAASALAWVVAEMERRATDMAKLAVTTVGAFNTRLRAAEARGETLVRRIETGFDPGTGQAIHETERLVLAPMPAIAVVIDELAELATGPGRGFERALAALARSGRATGIHLVIATQRPSATVVAGAIKANIPARMTYRTASRLDSRMVLGEGGAEELLGEGDLLLSSGPGQTLRLQGPLVGADEIAARVNGPRVLDRRGQGWIAGGRGDPPAPVSDFAARATNAA